MTRQGPAATAVTETRSPDSVKTCVMPILRPRRPMFFDIFVLRFFAGRPAGHTRALPVPRTRMHFLAAAAALVKQFRGPGGTWRRLGTARTPPAPGHLDTASTGVR